MSSAVCRWATSSWGASLYWVRGRPDATCSRGTSRRTRSTIFYDRLDKRCDAVVHVGMHGTVEWLPGQALGNDKESWSDVLLWRVLNLYLRQTIPVKVSLPAPRLRDALVLPQSALRAGWAYGVLAELKSCSSTPTPTTTRSWLTSMNLSRRRLWRIQIPTRGADAQAWVPAWIAATWRAIDHWCAQVRLATEVENRLFSSGLRAFGEAPDAERGTAVSSRRHSTASRTRLSRSRGARCSRTRRRIRGGGRL